MKLQVIPWAILAMSAASLVLGCVEWVNGRGHKLALAGVPTTALAVSMLLGDEPLPRHCSSGRCSGKCSASSALRSGRPNQRLQPTARVSSCGRSNERARRG
jgi:hypothetical protein